MAVALSGCVRDDIDQTYRVKLKGGLYYMPTDYNVTTKGNTSDTSGVLTPSSSTANPQLFPISLVRLDQQADDTYPSYTSLTELTATMGNPDPDNGYLREVSFSTPQFYKSSGKNIKFVGWYPRGTFASNSSGTTITQVIDGKTDVLLSNEVEGSLSDGFETMLMQHKLCLYRIYVYTMSKLNSVDEETGEPIDTWGNLVDITLGDTPTSCTLTLPNTVTYNYASKQDISLKNTAGIYFDEGELPVGFASKRLAGYVIAAPPEDGLLNLDVVTDKAAASQNVSIARNFKAGYAYDIVLCFSNHGIINAEVSVDEWVNFGFVPINLDADIYFNLSRYGTSNCYIVSSANTGYCFLGTVKGNGNGTPVGVSETGISPNYIQVLWESSPGLIELRSTTLSDGYVSFFVPGETLPNGKPDKTNLRLTQEGSAIIAAYDKAIGGHILWSWHIWITDRPKEQGYVNGYLVLDRNLGATSSKYTDGTATYGFYYQWGRKDPLIPGDSSYATDASATDITTATRHPFTLYGASSGIDDWNTTPNNKLWGYMGQSKEFEKTIYDPCPVGYRVPEKATWDKLAPYAQSPMGLFSIYTLSIWYPGAGYINNATGLQSSGIYNACCQPESLAGSNIFHFEYTAANNKAVLGSTATHSHTKAFAYPVRCISTNVKNVITNLSEAQTANSYVISETGYYKFKVTVRGNGADRIRYSDTGNIQIIGDDIPATINSSTISYVDLLWWQGALNSTHNNVADIPIELITDTPDKDGNVTIQVNSVNNEFVKGNAIIAAFNSSKEILWSWHIWLTDEPAMVSTGSYTVMDRNLGATYAPESSSVVWTNASRLATYGFYYEWGRKDPFPGPPAYNSGNLSNTSSSQWYYKNPTTKTWTTYTALFATASRTNVTNLSVAMKNPMTYYYGASTTGSTSTWYPNLTNAVRQSLWGYCVENQAGAGQSVSKTMFDPCPPGYIVCIHKIWGTARLALDEESIGAMSYYLQNDTYGEFFPTSNGKYYSSASTSSLAGDMVIGACWYPFQGYRDCYSGNVQYVGTYATSYTALPMTSNGDIRSYFMQNNQGSAPNYFARGCQQKYGPTYGRAVRCQKQ